jgi:hypothetical protein
MYDSHYEFIRHLIDHSVEVTIDMLPDGSDSYQVTFSELSEDGLTITDSDEDPLEVEEFLYYLAIGACRLRAKS